MENLDDNWLALRPPFRSLMKLMQLDGLHGQCELTNTMLYKQLDKHFEPSSIVGSDSNRKTALRSKTLKHIAQRYTLRQRTTLQTIEEFASAWELDLFGGVRLLFRFMNPTSFEEDPNEEFLYLVFLYLEKDSYDQFVCPFKEVTKFLKYVLTMKALPIKRVLFRPCSVQNMKWFNALPMVQRPSASTERLKLAYERNLKAKPCKFKDQDGKWFWEIPFALS